MSFKRERLEEARRDGFNEGIEEAAKQVEWLKEVLMAKGKDEAILETAISSIRMKKRMEPWNPR